MIRSLNIGIGILLSMVFIPLILDPVLWPRTVFLSLLSLYILLIRFNQKLALGKFSAILFGFVALHFFSLLWTFNGTETLSELSKYLSIIGIVFVLESLLLTDKIKTEFVLRLFFKASLVLMILGAISAILFTNWSGEGFSGMPLESTMANKNLLGAALWFGLFSSIQLYLNHSIRPTRFGSYFTAIGICLYFIDSRSALIASAVVLIHFAYVLIRQKKWNSILGVLTGLFAVSFLLSSVFSLKAEVNYQSVKAGNMASTMINFNSNEIAAPKKITDVYRPNVDDPSSVFSRLYLWKNSIKLWSDNPVIGTGPGTWKILFPALGLKDYLYKVENGWIFYNRPHNEFVRVLVELGLIGLIYFIGFICFSVYWMLSLIRKNFKSFIESSDSLYLSGVVAFSFILFVDFSLERPLTFLFFNLLLLSAFYSRGSRNRMANLHKSWLIIFPLFSLLVSTLKVKGEYNLKESMLLRAQQNWPAYSLKTLKIENVFYTIDPFSFPVLWHRAIALFNNEQYEESNKMFRQCAEITPYNLNVLNDLASSFYVIGNSDSALYYYNKALEISPRFEEALINKAAILLNNGRVEDSYETITKVYVFSGHVNYRSYLQAICLTKIEQSNLVEDSEMLKRIREMQPDQFLKMYIESDMDLLALVAKRE